MIATPNSVMSEEVEIYDVSSETEVLEDIL